MNNNFKGMCFNCFNCFKKVEKERVECVID